MDTLLAQILAFPPSSASDNEYDKQARTLLKNLEGASPGTLMGKTPDGEILLDLLNPAENSIAYVAVLSTYVETLQSKSGQQLHRDLLPSGALFSRIILFLENFDPVQVRYVGSVFRDLVGIVIRAARQGSQPWIAVPVLRDVILRLDPSSSTLTSTHLEFISLCLRLKLYRDAIPILELNIYNVPTTRDHRSQGKHGLLCAQDTSATYLTTATGLTTKLNSRHYMQYFLYAAMVHIALRQWRKALLYLEIVLMVPSSHTASMVMVEAYKKFILVGLLLKGKMPSTPRSTNSQALKHIRALARPYDVIAEAFNAHDAQRLQDDIEIGQREGVWQKDNNLGLIYEVLSAYRKFSVLRLSSTFAALPLTEVARRTSPDPSNLLETEQYISNLIVTGDLKAIISSDDPSSLPILRFLPTTTSTGHSKSEIQLQLEIARQRQTLSTLLEKISNDDHRIEVSRDYVEYLRKLKQNRDEEEKLNRHQQQQNSAGLVGGGSGTSDIFLGSGGRGSKSGPAGSGIGVMPGAFATEIEDEDVMADA